MLLLKWLKRKKPAKKSRPRSLPFSEEQIRAKAYEIWQERMSRGAPPQDDWHAAIQRLKQERSRRWQKPFRRVLSWLNQPLICLEKRVIEPIADWFERAAIFKIVEKLSPILEAIGVLMIPVAVWWFSQSYQLQKDEQEKATRQQNEKQERATRQQDAIKTYLNQLTTTFLDGDIKKDKNLQKVTRASTLALLQDPNMTGAGKGQVITFLSEIGLINKEENEEKSGQKLTKVSAPPVLSLSNADLSGAELSRAKLIGAELSRAKLIGADLSFAALYGADLYGAELSGTDLNGAKLYGADLRDAKLVGADLYGAKLVGADLYGAKLGRAKLSGAELSRAKLSHAELSRAKLNGADLYGADLYGADLSFAELRSANLSNAELRSADLSNADLSDADLSDADLSGAELRSADLSEARDLTANQLKDAKLCFTKLPPGITLNPNRDCKALELPEK